MTPSSSAGSASSSAQSRELALGRELAQGRSASTRAAHGAHAAKSGQPTGLRARAAARWRRGTRPLTWMQWAADIALAVAFEVVVGWPFVLLSDTSARFEPALIPSWLLYTAALVLRRHAPAFAFGLMWAAIAVKLGLQQGPHGQDLAVFLMIFSAAAYGRRGLRVVAAVSVVVIPALLVALIALVRQRTFLWDVLSNAVYAGVSVFAIVAAIAWFVLAVVGAASWLAGFLRRAQIRAQDAQHRKELAELERARAREQLVVEQERSRIARDMHDVVAHSLAVVIAQADGGRYAMRTDAAAAEQSLQTIAETAREALVDVRGLLAQLRHNHSQGPQPGLADIRPLIERMRDAGLDVDLSVVGRRRPIGAAAEIAVFRVVQESLTNSLRHGDPSKPTTVRVWWSDRLEVLVQNAVSPRPAPPRREPGHGLIGMRERIALVGGSLEAGRFAGDFRVRATVPYVEGPTGSVAAKSTSESEKARHA